MKLRKKSVAPSSRRVAGKELMNYLDSIITRHQEREE